MRILEIYESIQGELPLIGKPCTIVRVAGCNLTCPYCDAPQGDGDEFSLDEIMNSVSHLGNQHVLVTGGEPLIAQGIRSLLSALVEEDYIVSVETNGTIPLNVGYTSYIDHIIMDVKLFRAKVDAFATEERNLNFLSGDDAIKFVYGGEADVENAITFIHCLSHKIPESAPMIIFSPVMDDETKAPATPLFLEKIFELSKSFPHLDVRIQLQLHKILDLR